MSRCSYFVPQEFPILRKYTNSCITVCCKGPASTETLVQISWPSRGWFNTMRSLFYLSPFKIDPLSVSFSSSMRLKDCLWSNSANDQRFRLFFDMEIIQSCTSHDPETSPKFRWKLVLFLCLSEVMFISLEKYLWPKRILYYKKGVGFEKLRGETCETGISRVRPLASLVIILIFKLTSVFLIILNINIIVNIISRTCTRRR